MKIDVRAKDCLYVEINDNVFYIDDSTNEHIIETWKRETFLWVSFTRKPCDINDIAKNHGSLEYCKVEKNLLLTNKEYRELCKDFFKDNETLFEGIGGFSRDGSSTRVIRVINKQTRETLYINTEGYNYARYVGFESEGSK